MLVSKLGFAVWSINMDELRYIGQILWALLGLLMTIKHELGSNRRPIMFNVQPISDVVKDLSTTSKMVAAAILDVWEVAASSKPSRQSSLNWLEMSRG